METELSERTKVMGRLSKFSPEFRDRPGGAAAARYVPGSLGHQ